MKHIISLFLLFFTVSSFAQTIYVYDEISLQPIENVSIYCEKGLIITDKHGKANIFAFKDEISIIFTHTSYKDLHLSYNQIVEKDFEIKLSESVFNINEVVVSANSWEQDKSEVPNRISIIPKNVINYSNAQTAADLLKLSGEVFIQKSQLGGGSPMIRGFSANRVLLVVDGIRMNNAIYRSGNLQNVISLDANSIESSEIIFGPGSVIYGSDALGGVMDFHTLIPEFSDTSKINFSGNSKFRFSSANKEKTAHLDLNFGFKKLAFLTSFTYSSFDDLTMGSVGNNDYQRFNYIVVEENFDVMVENNKKNVQKYSGYDQINFIQKISYKPNKLLDFNYGFYYSTSSDIPRYDRLIQYSDDLLKYSEWYYGPQKWLMNSLSIKYTNKTLLFDKLRFVSSFQDYYESRHDRKFGNSVLRNRSENVKILTGNFDFEKELDKKSMLFYGAEVLYNKIYSKGNSTDIYNLSQEIISSRYPNEADYLSYSFYLAYKNNVTKKFTINSGIRYNRVNAYAVLDTIFFNFPFNTISLNTGALNGSIGIVYKPKSWQLSLNASSGFRAPNIDDLAKVFDSEPGNVVVPNDNVQPEYAYNLDLGILKRFGDKIQIDGSVFITYLDNALIRDDFQFNGLDSIIYDGELSKVQAIVNADNALIYGFQISLNMEITNSLSFKSNYNYTFGEDSEGKPLRHVSPAFGSFHLIYKNSRLKLDLNSEFNSEISYEKLAETERSKPYMYAINAEGNPYSPSWYTLNLNASYQINKLFRLQAAVENILDKRYRPYSSGIVAPGRNLIFSLNVCF